MTLLKRTNAQASQCNKKTPIYGLTESLRSSYFFCSHADANGAAQHCGVITGPNKGYQDLVPVWSETCTSRPLEVTL